MNETKQIIKDKSSEELAKLANDIIEGHIFGSWHIPIKEQRHLLCIIFLPLLFRCIDFKVNNIVEVYEYMTKRQARCINGYPTFTTCSLMTKNDRNNLIPMIKKLKKKKEKILKEIIDA